MPSPFPGMDPYLEHPDLWADVHNALIAALRDDISSALRPHYYVALEERTYLDDAPDLAFVAQPDLAVVGAGGRASKAVPKSAPRTNVLEVRVPMPDRRHETYLEVRRADEGTVVTVIELLSPSNKRPGPGRRLYLRKRRRILGTATSLVEVDLLRAGERMPTIGPPVLSDYRILVSRGRRRPKADLIPFGLRDPVPGFPLPLRPGEDEPTVNLGPVLGALYDRAGYDLRIDYRRPPVPPLVEADAAWADDLLGARRG